MQDEVLTAGETWGRAADSLTAGRALLALPVALVAWTGDWTAATLLLSAAWWSDFLDGRLARRAPVPTRLGQWDLAADTAVGAGLLTGLVGGGHLPPLTGAAGALLGIGFVMLGNAALGMVLQALAYGPVLWMAAWQGSPGFVVAALTISAIGVWDRARLLEYVLPTFFAGILGRREEEG